MNSLKAQKVRQRLVASQIKNGFIDLLKETQPLFPYSENSQKVPIFFDSETITPRLVNLNGWRYGTPMLTGLAAWFSKNNAAVGDIIEIGKLPNDCYSLSFVSKQLGTLAGSDATISITIPLKSETTHTEDHQRLMLSNPSNFAIGNSDTEVFVWTRNRLPFQPTGWLIDLKADIRKALSCLKVDANSTLYARYESTDRSFVDVENVLFYNVGEGGFSHLPLSRVIFERTFSNPIAPEGKTGAFPHYQYYTTDSTMLTKNWPDGKILAEFYSEPYPNGTRLSLADYFWYMVKKGNLRRSSMISRPTYFGLNLTVHSSNWSRQKIIPMLKPMLDGIVAALQVHDGTNRDFAKAPAEKLGITESGVWEMLMDDKMSILGRTSLLVTRNGIQWNPSDDGLVRAEIELVEDARLKNQFRVEGSLIGYK